MDLLIRKFKMALIELFNNTMLPVEVKRLVLFELMDEVNKKSDEVIKSQMSEVSTADKQESDDISEE